jgi:hypothetical protein
MTMAIKTSFDPVTGLLSAAGDNGANTITTIRPFLGRTVMRKMPFGAVFAAALVTTGVPAAVAGPPAKVTLPVDFIMFDPCSEEDVHFAGSETFSVAFSTNANTFHSTTQVRSHVDGVGMRTGASYRSNLESNGETNGSFAGFPVEFRVAENLDFIGQGTVVNEGIKETIRITVNGNGNITINRDSAELTCQGKPPLAPP